MRLTTRTNLAMRALMYCGVNPDRRVRKSDIAAACNASENHLAQVVHVLGQRGFLRTLRGRGGGLMLGRSPAEITVGAVFRALEAEVPFTECFEGGENACPLLGACRLRCVLQDALMDFYATLDRITLQDLVADNTRLQSLLRPA